jgi:DNA-binding MarR family transcriptional regulator
MAVTMARMDDIIHQSLRLRIMAALVVLAPSDQLDFTSLRDLLKATDGNLGAHILRLEEAGYVRVEKTFVSRKPRTLVSATAEGRAAFAEHVDALKAIIEGAEKPARGVPDVPDLTKGRGE